MEKQFPELATDGLYSWKRYAASIFLIVVLYVFLGTILFFVAEYVLGEVSPSIRFINYIQLNLSFIVLLGVLFFCVKYIHKRKIITLITPNERINIHLIFYGFIVYLLLTSAGTLVEYLMYPDSFTVSFNKNTFFVGLVIVIILTPIQTTAEELLFRGYLIQLLGLFFRNSIVIALLSSMLFVLPHLANPEVSGSPAIMLLTYFAIGFFFSITTLKSNSLEAVIGAHAANNLSAALLVNYTNSALETNSILFINEFHYTFSLIQTVVVGVVFYYLIARHNKNNGTYPG